MTQQGTALQTGPDNPLVTAFTQQHAAAIVPKAMALAVNTNEEYETAGQWLADLRKLRKAADEFFRPSISAADKAHKETLAVKAKALEGITQAEQHLDAQMTAHAKEVKRLQAEAAERERAAQVERDRLAREQREADEAAAAAARKVAEDAKIAIAAEAEASGNSELAEEILDEEVPEPPVAPSPSPAPAPVPAGPPPPATPTSSAISTRANWKARVTDLGALVAAVAEERVHLNAVEANETFLNFKARECRKEGEMYPGVDCYNDEVNARR